MRLFQAIIERLKPLLDAWEKYEIAIISAIFILNSIMVGYVSAHTHQPVLGGVIVTINLVCFWLQKVSWATMGGVIVHQVHKDLHDDGSWQNLSNFDGRENPVFWKAFWVNRVSSLTPPIMTFVLLNVNLPWPIVGWLTLDLVASIYGMLRIEAIIKNAGKVVAMRAARLKERS